MSNIERKRELLTFLFAKPKDQQNLFRAIINKELVKMKEHMSARPKSGELYEYNKQFDKMIYESKLEGIKIETQTLKEQMDAYANGYKHPSHISIIDRKLFILEMQLNIGVYNLMNNKSVKYYIDT